MNKLTITLGIPVYTIIPSWGAVLKYTGTPQVKIISLDKKNNIKEVGIQ